MTRSLHPTGKLNLLILGGTGFLGPAIVDAALARGHSMTLFNRGQTNADMYPELTTLTGDRDPDKDAGLSALEEGEWDAVLDTSGYYPRAVGASAELLAERCGQYVFISSISVYADGSVHGMTEDAEIATTEDETGEEITGGTYGPLKALCEQTATKVFEGRATNIRPGFIVGPLDQKFHRFPLWVSRVAKRESIVCPGGPDDPVQLIDARDIGDFCISCIEHKTYGDFNLCGPQKPTVMKQMVDALCEGTGTSPKRTWIPAAFLDTHLPGLSNGFVPWLPADSEAAGYGTVSIDKALKAGLKFRSLVETTRDTLEWLQTKPQPQTDGLAGLMDAGTEDALLKAWAEREQAGEG